jgi:hypothetical protein
MSQDLWRRLRMGCALLWSMLTVVGLTVRVRHAIEHTRALEWSDLRRALILLAILWLLWPSHRRERVRGRAGTAAR